MAFKIIIMKIKKITEPLDTKWGFRYCGLFNRALVWIA